MVILCEVERGGSVEGVGLFLANLVNGVLFYVNHIFGKYCNKCLEICWENKIETNLWHGITKASVWFLQKYYNRVCILQVRIFRKLSFKREIISNYYWLFQRREISFLLTVFRSLQRLLFLDNLKIENKPVNFKVIM